MRAIDSFRGACDIRVWLCQIAKHCYLSYLKKQRHTVNVEDFEHMADQDSAENVEEKIVRQSEVMQIHLLLHELPEPYKEVFMLRVFGGMFPTAEHRLC